MLCCSHILHILLIFGVCVVTFDTWHLAILFDLVQGIMLASQGKVLSPGNEGSLAAIVYVSSILLDLCSYVNFRALFFHYSIGAILCTCPAPVSLCAP